MQSILTKTYPGYEDYLFYSDGRVWSYARNRFIDGSTYKKDGYNRIDLNGWIVKRHRILAILFIPIPEELKRIPTNKLIVHHINRNKTDNRIVNLCWMTRKQHLDEHGNIDRMKGVNSKPVEMCDENWNHIEYFPSAIETSRKTGISKSSVQQNCTGGSKYVRFKGKNYRFRYINKEPNSGSNCL